MSRRRTSDVRETAEPPPKPAPVDEGWVRCRDRMPERDPVTIASGEPKWYWVTEGDRPVLAYYDPILDRFETDDDCCDNAIAWHEVVWPPAFIRTAEDIEWQLTNPQVEARIRMRAQQFVRESAGKVSPENAVRQATEEVARELGIA